MLKAIQVLRDAAERLIGEARNLIAAGEEFAVASADHHERAQGKLKEAEQLHAAADHLEAPNAPPPVAALIEHPNTPQQPAVGAERATGAADPAASSAPDAPSADELERIRNLRASVEAAHG